MGLVTQAVEERLARSYASPDRASSFLVAHLRRDAENGDDGDVLAATSGTIDHETSAQGDSLIAGS